MNQLFRAAAIGLVVWSGISYFKSLVKALEEEDLARHGAGESEHQRKRISKPAKSGKAAELALH